MAENKGTCRILVGKQRKTRVEDFEVDGGIISRRILQKQDGVVRIAFIWLWLWLDRTSGALLWELRWSLGFPTPTPPPPKKLKNLLKSGGIVSFWRTTYGSRYWLLRTGFKILAHLLTSVDIMLPKQISVCISFVSLHINLLKPSGFFTYHNV